MAKIIYEKIDPIHSLDTTLSFFIVYCCVMPIDVLNYTSTLY